VKAIRRAGARTGLARLAWAGLVALLTGHVGALGLVRGAELGPFEWPPAHREARPWSYWWWMGSAVNPTDLSRELERYRDAGLGGVHVVPIYGAKGYEAQYLEYLSPRWFAMLEHALREGRRLDLGLDMTTGTGWCFGGPDVSTQEANAKVVLRTFTVSSGERCPGAFERAATQALVAFGDSPAPPIDLTDRMGGEGQVDWQAPAGTWRVFAVSQEPSGQRVKRAAPGGAGHMLNPFFGAGLERYLARFTAAFAAYEGPRPRAMYHDSFEYSSEWTPDFFAQFERRRGYRLQAHLAEFFGAETNDVVARLKGDYRATLAELLIEGFIEPWSRWAQGLGCVTRNQAHGSPGNLLDLYAAADIPETEMFNRDRDPLVAKFASSAAHVAGRPRVSAETGTWLSEHFTETLDGLKRLADELFVSGVNHVFYHGTCYSPDDAPWPGWLFYASTQMNPRNPLWRDVPALNAYIARCQSFLQAGQPDHDVLVYWPIHDLWHQADGRVQKLTVHNTAWLHEQPLGAVARELWRRGYCFDYVSDRQLAQAHAGPTGIQTAGGLYRLVLVPPATHLPVDTLACLVRLAEEGATVAFVEHLPPDVPGLGDLETRRAQYRRLLERVRLSAAGDTPGRPAQGRIGQGRILVGALPEVLAESGVARESLVDRDGIRFIRRALGRGRIYFVVNASEQRLDDWMTLATPATAVVLLDPMTGQAGLGSTRPTADGNAQVRLQLEPGASLLLRTFRDEDLEGPGWSYARESGPGVPLTGSWRVEFIAGGPVLPRPFETGALRSWTEQRDPEAQRFAGTARYTLDFDAPTAETRDWQLDLGRVCHSARVRLNGRDCGIHFLSPTRLRVGALQPQANRLEIEVTNLGANRIRDLDRRGVLWKNFHDINFVNLQYRPFDAASWPLYDSGLLGPVTLTPLEPTRPARIRPVPSP